MKRALNEKTLTRFASLKENFEDRYFTAVQAYEFLKPDKKHIIYDLLYALCERGLLVKAQPPKRPAQYKVAPVRPITLDDAVQESSTLQAEEQWRTSFAKDELKRMSVEPTYVPRLSSALNKTQATQHLRNAAIEHKFRRYETLADKMEREREQPKLGAIPPAASALPATLVIDGVKYVRMDRIAELLLDQL